MIYFIYSFRNAISPMIIQTNERFAKKCPPTLAESPGLAAADCCTMTYFWEPHLENRYVVLNIKMINYETPLNFIYSEKATKFCEISTVDLSYVVSVKSTLEILQNFVANPTFAIWAREKWFQFFDKIIAHISKIYRTFRIQNTS